MGKDGKGREESKIGGSKETVNLGQNRAFR